MTTANQLIAELKKRSKGTPYDIESNDDGSFKLKLDIVDTNYYLLMYKHGVKRAFNIEAHINEARRTITTTDSLYAVDWRVGSGPNDIKPTVNWKAAVNKGEIYAKGFSMELGVKKDGTLGAAVNYGYDTGAAKKWLKQQLADLGWKRAWGKQAKIGLVFAIIGGVGALVTIITLLAILIISPESFNN